MAQTWTLRTGLIENADVDRAAELAEQFANSINDQLNALSARREATAATSLLARALTARALLVVAGDWWRDLGAQEPDCHHALRSFLDERA